MSAMTPFLSVPAIVLLIGIFFNTRSLYRRTIKTKYADKASSIATVFAIVSLSVPMLLFIGLPVSLKLMVWALCASNFGRSVFEIVRVVQRFTNSR